MYPVNAVYGRPKILQITAALAMYWAAISVLGKKSTEAFCKSLPLPSNFSAMAKALFYPVSSRKR